MLTITLVQEGKTGDGYKYRYNVRINYKVIASGKITSHDREDGWEDLVHTILEERGSCDYKDFHDQNYPT